MSVTIFTTISYSHNNKSKFLTFNNNLHQVSLSGKHIIIFTLFFLFTVDYFLIISKSTPSLNCTYTNSESSDTSLPSNIYEYSSISAPPKGTCKGPLHRVLSSMKVISKLNLGCPRNKIPYHKEGVLQIQCGECLPGTSGTSSMLNSFQCAANEYCTDDARCMPIKEHPLFGIDCPFEISSSIVRSDLEGIDTWCGPGLICIEHKCLSCREGDVDLNTGVKCILGEWTYASWMDSTLEPSPLLLFALCGVTLLYALINCSCRSIKIASKVVNEHKESKEHESLRKLTQEFVFALDKFPDTANIELNQTNSKDLTDKK